MVNGMDFRINKIVLFFVVILVVNASGFNARKGNFWICSGLSFQTIRVERDNIFETYSETQGRFLLSQTIRFFIVDHFFIGPELTWESIFSDNNEENMFIAGVELGLVSNKSNIFPYLLVSPGIQVYHGGSFILPFYGGLIIPVTQSLGLQFELGFGLGIKETHTSKKFSIGLGMCGLGKKTAISLLNILQ